MINATFALKAVSRHAESGITWVMLEGDEGFDWLLSNHPETPAGFVSISGSSNNSFRIIEKAAFERMLNDKSPE